MVLQGEYEKLRSKIEDVSREPERIKLEGEFRDFMNVERRNHQAIVKVYQVQNY